jgi:ATP-dependent Clp protease adaptor protein ClpS
MYFMSESTPKAATQLLPPTSKPLPRFKVLLHNDDKNDVEFVINTIIELTPLGQEDAFKVVMEAHETGASLVLVTHKELAELYTEQLTSKGLTATLEADA